MGLFKNHKRGSGPIENSPIRNKSSLPPISQYAASLSTKPNYAYYSDEVTKINTARNSGIKPILKNGSTSANAAAAVALSRSNSLKKVNDEQLKMFNSPPPRPRSAQSPRSIPTTRSPARSMSSRASPTPNRTSSITSRSSYDSPMSNYRTMSLTRIDEQPNDGVEPLTNTFRAPSFNSSSPQYSPVARRQSMTSLLSNNSLDMTNMSIQSTTTKKGSTIIRKTKIMDADGVVRRVITKTVKKVGPYEVVNSNIVNLTNGEMGNIDELVDLDEMEDEDEYNVFLADNNDTTDKAAENEQFEGFDEPLHPMNEIAALQVPEAAPDSETLTDINHEKLTEDTNGAASNDGSSNGITSNDGLLTTASTNATSEAEYVSADSSKNDVDAKSAKQITSILHKSTSPETFDMGSSRSNKSKVSFKGVEYIENEKPAEKPTEEELYKIALKKAEAKVYGDSIQRSSSFIRAARNKNSDDTRYSMRPVSGEGSPAQRFSESRYSTPRRTQNVPFNESPVLRKKPSISNSLRAMSLASFSINKPPPKGVTTLRFDEKHKVSRKEKRFMKEQEKLKEMSLQEEINNVQRKLAKKNEALLRESNRRGLKPDNSLTPIKPTTPPSINVTDAQTKEPETVDPNASVSNLSTKTPKKRFKFFNFKRS